MTLLLCTSLETLFSLTLVDEVSLLDDEKNELKSKKLPFLFSLETTFHRCLLFSGSSPVSPPAGNFRRSR